jgi:hypothetical protein
MTGPLEIVGDEQAAVCEDDVCVIPDASTNEPAER